jgi:hypothetical protein
MAEVAPMIRVLDIAAGGAESAALLIEDAA